MAKDFFTPEDQQRIKTTIAEAEKITSGEVKVHIENRCRKPALVRATEIFQILNMHRTALRNGVLFYLAVKDKQFAILGDSGIDQKVDEHFWDEIKTHMESLFRDGKFTDGLCDGIEMAGKQLGKYFPVQVDDSNELSDDISFGNN
jgi:uncharacterized membrane protein